jgi:hypothetical protein
MFYLNGPGGTGKTFLLSSILDLATLEKMNIRVVAAFGVAALLLKDGQTAHSVFKISIDLEAGIECTFAVAAALAQVDLILWDEIVMMHRYGIEAVDLSLRKATGIDRPFGGKVITFSGDFRQILPVVKYNEYPKAYDATLKLSPLWNEVSKFSLVTNMRLVNSTKDGNLLRNKAFGENLLKLGEGRLQLSDYAIIDFDGIKIG